MSPVAIRTFRTVNSKLDLNGPILSFSEQPTSVSSSTVGDTKTFTATAAAAFPASQTSRNTNTGTLTYQWYTRPIGIDGPWTAVSNESRINDNGTTTVISGATTNTLSIASVQYAEDDEQEYKVRATYNASAYGSGNLSPNAWNNPLDSNSASLSVTPVLSIVTQPAEANGTTETQTLFVVSATSDDANLIATITYQWQLQTNSSGSWGDIANSDVITGATTNRLTIRTIEGTHKIRCIVSHTISEPSPITSDDVTFTVENPRLVLMRQDVDGGGYNPVTGEYFAPYVTPPTTTNINSNSIHYEGALHITGSQLRKERDVDQWIKGSQQVFVWAPEQDLDVMVEMAGAGGGRVRDYGDIQVGYGGWGVFRMTLKQNQEYTFKIGCSGEKNQRQAWGPRGGGISGDPTTGGPGGGGCYMYEGNSLVAVIGGGGGAGRGGAGGDGSQFRGTGQKGFGRFGGEGGRQGYYSGRQQSRFSPDRRGGGTTGCSYIDVGNGSGRPRGEWWHYIDGWHGSPYRGRTPFTQPSGCSSYTMDSYTWPGSTPGLGPYVDNENMLIFDGTFQQRTGYSDDHTAKQTWEGVDVGFPQLIPVTAYLKRGYVSAEGGPQGDHGTWSGGWGMGDGGGGGAGAQGGSGSGGSGYGGGGGSSWTDKTVLRTVAGGHGGDAYVKIMIYDPDNIPVGPTPPNPPQWSELMWNDDRAPGCKWGGSFAYYHDQSDPSQRGIKGPTGTVGNNTSWLGDFTDSANFNRCGANSDNISYINFSLNIYGFGPRTTESDSFRGESQDDGRYSTIYLTNNRGNRDRNRGRTRKWIAPGRSHRQRENWIKSNTYHQSEWNPSWSQQQRDERQNKWTASLGEAFVPFKMDFTIRFSFQTEPQSNTYRVMEAVKTYEWWNWGTYQQVEFSSVDLARANNLGEQSGRLYLPDAGLNYEQRPAGYSGPRIDFIRSRMTNLDTGQEGGINPFWMAYDPSITGDDDKPYSHNFVEFGRSVFT